MSDSSQPHGLQAPPPTRFLHPWDFPGKSTGVGCHCLLQRYTNSNMEKSTWKMPNIISYKRYINLKTSVRYHSNPKKSTNLGKCGNFLKKFYICLPYQAGISQKIRSYVHKMICVHINIGSDDKESACNARNPDLTPGLGRSPGEGTGYPLQCSCL